MGKHFGPVEPLAAAAYVKKRFARYDAEYARAGGRKVHVTFETLVESPRQFVDAFASHFDVTPTQDPDAALATIRRRPNRTARWKSLRPPELAACEGLLQDELIAYGYTLASDSASRPSNADIITAHALDAFNRIPQKLRRIANLVRQIVQP
jgi:hypothetical protein